MLTPSTAGTAAAIDGLSWRNVAARLAQGAFPRALRDGRVPVLVGHESAFVHVPGQDPVQDRGAGQGGVLRSVGTEHTLTMITCWPVYVLYFVPHRTIVSAIETSSQSTS